MIHSSLYFDKNETSHNPRDANVSANHIPHRFMLSVCSQPCVSFLTCVCVLCVDIRNTGASLCEILRRVRNDVIPFVAMC